MNPARPVQQRVERLQRRESAQAPEQLEGPRLGACGKSQRNRAASDTIRMNAESDPP